MTESSVHLDIIGRPLTVGSRVAFAAPHGQGGMTKGRVIKLTIKQVRVAYMSKRYRVPRPLDCVVYADQTVLMDNSDDFLLHLLKSGGTVTT